MTAIYTVIDQYGFIAAFDNLPDADKLLNEFKDVDLFIMQFPIDRAEQKKLLYFLPYQGCNAVALVSNNKKYVMNIQTQLMRMNLTYPDNINFYTREFNKIYELEYKRLVDPEFRKKEEMFDEALLKYEEISDKANLFEGGMPHEQYRILDEEYGFLVDCHEEGSSCTPSEQQSGDAGTNLEENQKEATDGSSRCPPPPPSPELSSTDVKIHSENPLLAPPLFSREEPPAVVA